MVHISNIQNTDSLRRINTEWNQIYLFTLQFKVKYFAILGLISYKCLIICLSSFIKQITIAISFQFL